MKSITALAAVAVTGLPPEVEMVAPFRASAISGRATVRPTGVPLPRPFALVRMSGCTPYCSMPNHLPPVRPQPVCTSSLIKMPHNVFKQLPSPLAADGIRIQDPDSGDTHRPGLQDR